MNTPFSSTPWNTPALWREANTSLERIKHLRREMERAFIRVVTGPGV